LRKFLLVAVVVLTALITSSTATASTGAAASHCAARHAIAPVLCAIHYWRNHTWRYQHKLGVSVTPYGWTAERSRSAAYRTWVRSVWHKRYLTWRKRWINRPVVPRSVFNDFMCIHHYEGAWNDETGNGYHGGLQMDYSFETTYGPEFYAQWGDAGHWPPIDQIIAAYRAYLSRGFSPWPEHRADCGLL
jgi:hypothetical protein